MKKQELIDLFEKAKKIGIALCEWNNPERYYRRTSFEQNGDFNIEFEVYHHGDTDYNTEIISFDDLVSDTAENIIEKTKAARLKEYEEKQLKLAQESRERSLKALADKEAKDRADYERLKAIFDK